MHSLIAETSAVRMESLATVGIWVDQCIEIYFHLRWTIHRTMAVVSGYDDAMSTKQRVFERR